MRNPKYRTPILNDNCDYQRFFYWGFNINEDEYFTPPLKKKIKTGYQQQFTGFKDKNGIEIYEGDILSDHKETDEGLVMSKCQVFWNKFTGSWHLDNSTKQDESYSTELWQELNDFEYWVSSHIYEPKKGRKKKKKKASTPEPSS